MAVPGAPTQTPQGQPDPAAPRVISDQDKALAKAWLKKIDDALTLRKDDERRFEQQRKLLRGINADGKKMRVNLHFANLAAMRPQVYAKDPEFAVTPTKAVPDEQLEQWRAFGEAAEAVLEQLLVRDARLKRRMKRQLVSAYACSVGWLKACWQEQRGTDPIIVNQIKDTQDNLSRLQQQRAALDDPNAARDTDLKLAELHQTLQGLQSQSEIIISNGATLDFVLPEDLLVIDASVREIGDYERAEALAHRVWMTRDQYQARFGYDPKKGKSYREQTGGSIQAQGGSNASERAKDLLAVWEVWDQASNRVLTVCEGEEGFCRQPYSPDWTGERWYPFFLLSFNEVDGGFFPLSDVELTEKVVEEYNQNRDDQVRDRKGTLPLNVVRKGGSLTPDDVEKIANRQGSDVIVVEGVGGRPIGDDIFSGQLGQLKPENYDTAPARQDMEQLVGGGDAARGSVLKAKTATEAEILSQGLRGRSAERTDVIEDMLSELGKYVLEMALRKLSANEVKKIAGTDAVWPQLRAQEVFQMVSLAVRGGSTGKPDRLQEQDRWTKLLPVIEKAMEQVGKLREAGQEDAAQAVIHLVRETLRRFDERIDIERFLPPPKKGEETGKPNVTPEMMQQAQQAFQQVQQELAECQKALDDKGAQIAADVDKTKITAAASVTAAEEVARIKAAADIEVAKIGAAAKVMAPQPDEPAGVVTDLAALEAAGGLAPIVAENSPLGP